MKLYSRRFVRLLRRHVRSELRGSQKLWKEYKRRREGPWRRPVENILGLPLLLGMFYVLLSWLKPRPDLLLALLALYATGTPFLRLASLRAGLSTSFERALLYSLPVSDGDFFQFAWNRFLRSSLWVFGAGVAAYGYVALMAEAQGSAGLVIFGAAVLQWAAAVAATVLLYRFRPEQRPWPGLMLYGFGALLCFFPLAARQPLQAITDWLPAGWIHSLFSYTMKGGLVAASMLVIPAVGLLAIVWTQSRRLQQSYRESETAPPLSPQEFEEDEEETAGMEAPTAEWHQGRDRFASLRTEESIRAGALGEVPDWASAGWIERIVGAWLTERERRVADFLLGGAPRWWTAQWRQAAWVLSVCTLACLLVPFLPRWAYVSPLLIGAAMAAPFLGGGWPGFESRYTGASLSPMYAVYPVVYSELSRVILKANVVRLAAWFPLGMAYAAALSWRWQVPIAQGLDVNASLFFVLAASQPLAVAGKISRRTNDTRAGNRASLAFSGVLLVGILVYLPLAIAVVVPVPLLWKLLLAAGFLALCMAGAWLYGVLFDRGRIDLLHEPGN